MTRLVTQRLQLDPWTAEDAPAFHAIWGDPEVIWWGANESYQESREGLTKLLARHADWPPGIGWFAVRPKEGGEILGDVLLQPAPFAPGTEIGWHFRRSAWGQGFAAEAAQAVLAHGLGDLGLTRIYAIVATQNQRSLRITEKLGMVRQKDMEYAGLPHVLFAADA